MATEGVVEARGGTASASSGSDVIEHEDPCVATATSERRAHHTKASFNSCSLGIPSWKNEVYVG